MTIKELKEKWEELFIRFNTSPKMYLKFDYLKLIKFLKDLIENSDEGALHEDDLKTINGESVVGEGDIEIKGQVLTAGNKYNYFNPVVFLQGNVNRQPDCIIIDLQSDWIKEEIGSDTIYIKNG